MYMDEHTMSPQGYTGASMLIPTRVSLLHQTKKCIASKKGREVCNFETTHNDTHFVAGVENFTLLFRHTFSAETTKETIRGSNIDHHGYVQRCDDWLERKNCRDVKLEKHGHPKALPNLFHITYGDVMSIGALLNTTLTRT